MDVRRKENDSDMGSREGVDWGRADLVGWEVVGVRNTVRGTCYIYFID